MENQIADKIRELGEVIIQSQTMKNLQEAELDQMRDIEAQKAISAYEVHRESLVEEAKEGGLTKEKLESVREKIDAEYQEVSSIPVVARYLSCKKEWDDMLSELNNMLNFYLTGETNSGCSGNGCSSCSGCSH